MTTQTKYWETGALPDLQYDAWVDVLNDRFGQWEAERPTAKGFFARTNSSRIDSTQFVECICDPCAAIRPARRSPNSAAESLTFQLVVSGRELFEIGDSRHILTPGDLLIWNDLNAMRFDVSERLHKISVTVPMARLRNWFPTRWHSIEQYHPKGSPVASVMSSLMTAMLPEALNERLRDGHAVADAMMGSLVCVLGTEAGFASGIRDSHIHRAKSYIAANLPNPDLSPADVAAAAGVSVRHLHSLFESADLSVHEYIMSQRLERIHQDLAKDSMRNRTITDIAFAWGFQSSAHFSRRFRAAFGLSPSAFRKISLQDFTPSCQDVEKLPLWLVQRGH